MPLNVNLARLCDAVKKLEEFDKTCENTAEDIDKRIKGLHLTFLGETATALQEAHNQWNRGVVEMRDGLAELKKAVQNAHKNYHTAVAVNKRMWPS